MVDVSACLDHRGDVDRAHRPDASAHVEYKPLSANRIRSFAPPARQPRDRLLLPSRLAVARALAEGRPIAPIARANEASLSHGWGKDLRFSSGEISPEPAAEELPRAPAVVIRRVLVRRVQMTQATSFQQEAEKVGAYAPQHPSTTRCESEETRTSEEETASTKSSDDDASAGCSMPSRGAEPRQAMPEVLPGEPIAFDARGQPIILRHVDAAGQSRHIVCNEDGSLHTFGERTVESILNSEEERTRRWLEGLSDRDLRGLVHELGQRLLQSSQLYQRQQGVLESLSSTAGYSFFGLSADCTEKELDNAYRRMAKTMHPDKNGGTVHAKQRFQNMKERYEALKEMRAGGKEPPPPEDEQPRSGDTDGRIEFDPADRRSLDATVWKMVRQLRTLTQGLKEVAQKIGRRS
ncbi:unnamed protein product [Effrenium voratum]|nr:unnamed protein product [Effrenium voratum]